MIAVVQQGNHTIFIRIWKNIIPKGEPKKTINAVFISHLHNDHINGLESLLQKTNVRYLFLPQLTDEIILESLLYNAYLNKGTWNITNNIILELYNSNDKTWIGDTQIIKINSENNENGESEVIDFVDFKPNSFYNSGAVFKYHHWLYKPINFCPNISKKISSKYGDSFYEFFKQQVNGGQDFDLSDIKNIFFRDHQKCIDAYTTYFSGNHNPYSMALFSGTERPRAYFVNRNPYKCRCCHRFEGCEYRRCFSANFLYTGDFEPTPINVNILKNTLDRNHRYLWHTISGIQVPHHGSRNNFNCELYVYILVLDISLLVHVMDINILM